MGPTVSTPGRKQDRLIGVSVNVHFGSGNYIIRGASSVSIDGAAAVQFGTWDVRSNARATPPAIGTSQCPNPGTQYAPLPLDSRQGNTGVSRAQPAIALVGCVDYVTGDVALTSTDDITFEAGHVAFSSRYPLSYWDIVAVAEKPVDELRLEIEDAALVGQKPRLVTYAFTKLGSLRIEPHPRYYRQSTVTLLYDPVRDTVPADPYLEVNSIFQVTVRAFDGVHGEPFHAADLALMDLCLVVRGEGASGVRTSCTGDGNVGIADAVWDSIAAGTPPNVLLLQGLRPGTYDVEVRGRNYNDSTPVVSNAIRVSFFEPLTVTPSELVLLPGGHTVELSARGGPASPLGVPEPLHYAFLDTRGAPVSGAHSVAVAFVDPATPVITTTTRVGSAVLRFRVGPILSRRHACVCPRGSAILIRVPVRERLWPTPPLPSRRRGL